MRETIAGFLVLLFFLSAAHGGELEVREVTKDVYAIVGPLAQRSPENLGNNATFGLVLTADGAVLIDPGGSAEGARVIEKAVSTVTDRPIKMVINTGGQDHRWLGNGYFKSKGATIVAAEVAVADQEDRVSMQLTILNNLIGSEKLQGTAPVFADVTFAETHSLKFGGVTFELNNPGPAHTPGDTFVWLPEKGTVFTGDIVYVDRLLGVMSYSDSKSWIASFSAIAALNPAYVVPGHGYPTNMSEARAQTHDYLVSLRKAIGAHIDAGGNMIGSVKVDQSAFRHITLFDQLARRNAQAVFAEMEFE